MRRVTGDRPAAQEGHRLCVAPMLDWTDRHCRYFLRLFSPRMWLYTEMITTPAILRGRADELLSYHPAEQPLALQLGGADPAGLAAAARIASERGYREINLNVGCPSDRVQNATFGACDEPARTRGKLREGDAGRDGRHDHGEDAGCASTTVTTMASCTSSSGPWSRRAAGWLIVHARKALLQGLSPKQNREIPPLHYDRAWQLKQDFPALFVIVNGGLRTVPQAAEQWRHVDGVMLGREAYHNPYVLSALHAAAWGRWPRATVTGTHRGADAGLCGARADPRCATACDHAPRARSAGGSRRCPLVAPDPVGRRAGPPRGPGTARGCAGRGGRRPARILSLHRLHGRIPGAPERRCRTGVLETRVPCSHGGARST